MLFGSISFFMASLLLVFLTPSRAKSARRCIRRWWWENVAKIPRVEKPWRERGNILHKQGENYFVYGILPPSPAVQALLPFFDRPPHPRALVEATLPDKPTQRAEQYQVRVDHVGAVLWKGEAVAQATDLKFRSSWEEGFREAQRAQHAQDMTEAHGLAPELKPGDVEALAHWKRDEQALMNGWAVAKMARFIFRWLLAKLKLPSSGAAGQGPQYENLGATVHPLIVRYEAGEVAHLLGAHVRPLAAQMAQYERETVPSRVPPTGFPHACDDYGGCAFKQHCRAAGTPVPYPERKGAPAPNPSQQGWWRAM